MESRSQDPLLTFTKSSTFILKTTLFQAKLLDICLSKGNVVASEKVIRNLMHFAASDPDVTPPIQANPDLVELGIISLERSGTSKQSSKISLCSTVFPNHSWFDVTNV